MKKSIEITGKIFNRLTVVKYSHTQAYSDVYFCTCSCGNTCLAKGYLLISGKKKSCGCLKRENDLNRSLKAKERRLKDPAYRLIKVWKSMKYRCYNPKSIGYHRYGGRGIKVCDEWFENSKNFLKWAIDNGYKFGLEIDRINNNGNYEPSNCRWATSSQNSNNRSTNVMISFNGYNLNIKQWSEKTGFNCSLIRERLARGWSVEDCLSVKPEKGRNQTWRK